MKNSYTVVVNGQAYKVEAFANMPILWVLRDVLGLTGTKYGCGIGQCGACTIHVNGKAERACLTAIGSLGTSEITTIEGLSTGHLHPVQNVWIEEQVPQCGYCQSGQMMNAAALLAENPNPTEEEIISRMSANLCRCGTYPRIFKAIKKLANG